MKESKLYKEAAKEIKAIQACILAEEEIAELIKEILLNEKTKGKRKDHLCEEVGDVRIMISILGRRLGIDLDEIKPAEKPKSSDAKNGVDGDWAIMILADLQQEISKYVRRRGSKKKLKAAIAQYLYLESRMIADDKLPVTKKAVNRSVKNKQHRMENRIKHKNVF